MHGEPPCESIQAGQERVKVLRQSRYQSRADFEKVIEKAMDHVEATSLIKNLDPNLPRTSADQMNPLHSNQRRLLMCLFKVGVPLGIEFWPKKWNQAKDQELGHESV